MAEKEYPFAKGYCDVLIEFLEGGNAFENFSGEIKVPMRVIKRWLVTEPDFQDAHEIGMAKYRTYWEKIEMAKIVGGGRRKKSSGD